WHIYFFFFQAEDGIRDRNVTGVQTCALPILGSILGLVFGEKAGIIKPLGDIFINLLFMVVVPLVFFSISSAIANMDSMKRFGKRSEERRVGKECCSRRSRSHCKEE